jgi:hypothetical protein
MMTITWPSTLNCLFAAMLYGGADPNLHRYEPVSISPAQCAPYVSYIQEGTLVLKRGTQQVVIPLPKKEGWRQMEYWWGRDVASIEGKDVPIRRGPVEFY